MVAIATDRDRNMACSIIKQYLLFFIILLFKHSKAIVVIYYRNKIHSSLLNINIL